MIPAMKIGAIAPWFGGKRTLADVIVGELGNRKSYWELFCGSAAVLLAKPSSSQETICDLHGDLTNLAWTLQSPKHAEILYDRVSRCMFTESLFERAREFLSKPPVHQLVEQPCIEPERAFFYFVFSWMGRNGLAGTSRAMTASLSLRYTSGGGSPVIRFRSAIESIPAWHYRLLNVLVLRRDAFTLLPEIDDSDDVVLYIDSPYLMETRSDGAAFDQGARYVHDFDEKPPAMGLFAADGESDAHDRLAMALSRFKMARVVVSYYDHPRLRTLYPGWTFRSVAINKNIASQNRRGLEARVEAPEVLIINGPSHAQEKAP